MGCSSGERPFLAALAADQDEHLKSLGNITDEGGTMAKRLTDEELEGAVAALQEQFGGGIEKIRRTKPRDPEKAERAKAKKGRKPASKPETPPATSGRAPAERPATFQRFQRRETVQQRPVQRPQQQPEYSAFGRAVYLARQVEDRDQDTSELSAVVAGLEDGEKKNLVFRVQREVLLEAKVRLPALFVVCKAAKVTGPDGKVRDMLGVAYATAAVYKAMHEGGMSLEDMLAVGLATVTTFQTKEGRTVTRTEPRISRETLQQASRQLRKRNKRAAAEILENYLLGVERRRAEAQARRKAKTAEPAEEAEPAEAEA